MRMRSQYIYDITDLDWNLFEEKYNISRTEMVEIDNIYNNKSTYIVHKNDLNLWNELIKNPEQSKNTEMTLYEIEITDKKWIERKIKN
jgi:hypothetical protein